MITSLSLKQFRSYNDYVIELNPGVNIVVGPNASGKTNLLEAILVASLGHSYRAKDEDLIEFNFEESRIEMNTEKQNRIVKLRKNNRLKKQIFIDDVEIKRLTNEKIIPITLFEPEHLRLINGSPEIRRDYLDGILEITNPNYKQVRRQYKRALAQRNRLLKNPAKIIADQIFVWDLKLSEFGSIIHHSREDLINKINKLSSEVYSDLSGKKSSVVLNYDPTIKSNDYASSFLKGLNERLNKDIERGFTTIGPHRDDVSFNLDKHEASVSASRGETRSLILMCKLIEMKIIEQDRGQKPILLLDDVFSELDSSRRRSLTEYLKDYQTIITTTDADAIIKHFLGDYNIIPTSKNQLDV